MTYAELSTTATQHIAVLLSYGQLLLYKKMHKADCDTTTCAAVAMPAVSQLRHEALPQNSTQKAPYRCHQYITHSNCTPVHPMAVTSQRCTRRTNPRAGLGALGCVQAQVSLTNQKQEVYDDSQGGQDIGNTDRLSTGYTRILGRTQVITVPSPQDLRTAVPHDQALLVSMSGLQSTHLLTPTPT